MNIYILNAGGYYTVGTAVVAAPDVFAAAELANAASEYKELTYHTFGGNSEKPVGVCDSNESHVMNIHEWGMGHLPSKGSGVKVTF